MDSIKALLVSKSKKKRAVSQSRRCPKLTQKDDADLQKPPSLMEYYLKEIGNTLLRNGYRNFTLGEIEDATRNFDDKHLIDENVYKGVINSISPARASESLVAVKRVSREWTQEFLNDVELVPKIHHPHVVTMIGFCNETDEMFLVYEYMAEGSLRGNIYNDIGKPTLGWRRRLEICIGAARGLHYLHSGFGQPVVHREINTANILLDESWISKIDFKLFKNPAKVEHSRSNTVVTSNSGYLDPEYLFLQRLTDKSDVYSFGVVLFEVLCGRPAVDETLPKEQVNLVQWARLCYRDQKLEDIVDPVIKGTIVQDCFDKFSWIAYKCTEERGVSRPSMKNVLWNLEFCLQQQARDSKESGPELKEGVKQATVDSC